MKIFNFSNFKIITYLHKWFLRHIFDFLTNNFTFPPLPSSLIIRIQVDASKTWTSINFLKNNCEMIIAEIHRCKMILPNSKIRIEIGNLLLIRYSIATMIWFVISKIFLVVKKRVVNYTLDHARNYMKYFSWHFFSFFEMCLSLIFVKLF